MLAHLRDKHARLSLCGQLTAHSAATAAATVAANSEAYTSDQAHNKREQHANNGPAWINHRHKAAPFQEIAE